MDKSLTCVLISLLMWQPVTAEVRQANFHVLQKGTRPSNGRSISTQSGGTVTSCAMMCLSDRSCTSFKLREATSCQNTCELRDQSGVTETLLEADSTASYYTTRVIPCDCAAIQTATPTSTSGVYIVRPVGGTPIEVYCDMDTGGGGWLIFQERHNGSLDFYLNWEPYALGFGHPSGEFWLGNRNLHLLTQQKNYTLRVDLSDWEGNQAYARYSRITINSEQDKFRLVLGPYTGDAGDALTYHSGVQFSTRDQDNDEQGSRHCAEDRRAGWWFNACSDASLNGLYYNGAYPSSSGWYDGVVWIQWKGYGYSLKTTKMMIRPEP